MAELRPIDAPLDRDDSWKPPEINASISPDDQHQALLYLDVPQDTANASFDTQRAVKFFTHFAYDFWNAGQGGVNYLTRSADIENHLIRLYASDEATADLSDQVSELVGLYDAARDPEDDYTNTRIRFIGHLVQKTLVEIAEHPEHPYYW